MRIEPLAIDGLLLVEPSIFTDARGYFFESYNEAVAADAGIGPRFVQDNQSRSLAGVLRGLHAQLRRPQGKLVRVVEGEIFDVAVDLRLASASFGHWAGARLSAENRLQLWVPPGFAHGFCVLSDVAVVLYKCTALYDPTDEIGVRWDDAAVGIEWPVDHPLVSDKDSALPGLAELRPRLEAAPAYAAEALPPTP
jgi:dTDP-4-dehydrorhamnose 3,5-epimerase